MLRASDSQSRHDEQNLLSAWAFDHPGHCDRARFSSRTMPLDARMVETLMSRWLWEGLQIRLRLECVCSDDRQTC